EVQPLPPSRLEAEIPHELEQIILKVLAKEPSARYRTADQLGRVLIGFQKQFSVDETPIPEVTTEQKSDTAPTETVINIR
ncbi:MAG: hypothetical protein GWN00_35770, partial [Aliifodinibius sp.]|nr:hypothetical protein [Fodinibius sp.]NIV15989.1 hypothetical protein [Fodinibius sp.]NIY29956.1 hypothetical protein [Fodinibius sp.]